MRVEIGIVKRVHVLGAWTLGRRRQGGSGGDTKMDTN
jgi:hypothetical protein